MSISGRPRLAISAAYFAFFGGLACYGPYIVLHLRGLGLSGTQIGLLNALTPLGAAFMSPLWGNIADARGAHRLILRMATLTAAAVMLLLTSAHAFWQIALLIVVYALIGTTAQPLLDSYGVAISARMRLSYGQLRVWGSIGYMLAAWLIGRVMGAEVSTLFLFCFAVALALTCVASLGLPSLSTLSERIKSSDEFSRHVKANRWRGAASLLRRPDIRIVLLAVFMLAVATNPVQSLFGVYFRGLGASASLVGTATAIAAFSELPMLFLGGRLNAWLGSRRMFIIALVVYGVRMALYSVVPSTTWVLPIQLLHGMSFGFGLMASVTLIHELAGPEFAATAQALIASAAAFGNMSGALLSGALLDRIDIRAIYLMSSALTVLTILVCLIGLRRPAMQIKG